MSQIRLGPPIGDDRGARLARYYDLDLVGEIGDIDLYRALASRVDGPVLELASGTGRVSVPLALAGYRVTGVDLDPAALARAQQAWQRALDEGERSSGTGSVEFLEGDLRDLELGPRFSLVILALNSLMLLGDAPEQAAALRAMARHLRPGGLAVVDLWIPSPDDLTLYDGRLIHEWTRDDLDAAERVAKLTSAHYDAATAVIESENWFDAWPREGGSVNRTQRTDRLRVVGAVELIDLAQRAGLEVDRLGGDYELTRFGQGSDRAVLVARLL